MMSGHWPKAAVLRAYRTAAGLGASPDGFMKMALDSARNLLLRAETAIDAGAQVEKAQALASAATLVEFMLGLTGSDPGELSECLASVYKYVLAAILKGNARDDREAVTAARVALDELATTWRAMFPDAISREESGAETMISGRRDHA